MATPDGAPLIEGLQADGIGPTAAGRRMMVDIPLDTAGLAQDLGTPTPGHLLGGLMFRPTLTIRGLQSGFGARIRPRHRSSFRWHGRSWPRWSARTGRAGRPVADGACPSSRSPTSWVCRRWLSQTLMHNRQPTSTCGSTTSSKASAPPRRFSGTWPEHGYRPRGSAPTHGARGSRGPSRMTDSAASAHRDPRALTAAQTESYDRLDYLSPLVAMPPSGAQAPRWKLEAVEASPGPPSSTPVEDLLGPDLLVLEQGVLHQGRLRLQLRLLAPRLDLLAIELPGRGHRPSSPSRSATSPTALCGSSPEATPATRSRIGTRSRPPIS